MHDQRTCLLQVGGHYKGSRVYWATVDASDFGWLSRWNWSFGRYVYRPVWIDGKKTTLGLHRFIVGLEHGDERQVDHINRDRLDNRRENLRIATNAQNSENVPSRGGTSQHRGVCWDRRSRKWAAQIQVRGRMHNLGRYANEEEAAAVARAARREHPSRPSEAMKTFRRYISRALGRAAFRIDPDPPLKFTTTRRVTLTAEGDRDAFERAFTKPYR